MSLLLLKTAFSKLPNCQKTFKFCGGYVSSKVVNSEIIISNSEMIQTFVFLPSYKNLLVPPLS